ncbi:MAG: NAD/NADP octopine/nopaline dehydrogenase family protein [Deltaproteobacteria bacterium]|nr:NAD/NADP octopine/nopaline dehydrogenase family protein [Deltaproteobacteria bacterium]
MSLQTVAIIGAGNGGHAAAAELALMGYTVRMHDVDPDVVAGIASRGGVEVSGVMSGFGPVAFAGTDLAQVVEGAEYIMVITARFAHARIAEALAPLLREDAALLLNPGSSCGALEFAKVLREKGCRTSVSTTATLPYAARVEEPGRVRVTLLARTLFFATFPGRETETEARRWGRLFPELEPMSSDLEVSLNNGNPITHPAPMLLNAARIENTKGDFLFYREGTSPSVVRVSEALDRERLALCRALGLAEIPATERLYRLGYAEKIYPTLLEVYKNSQAFGPIKAPESMDYRYVYEDIPYGSVFFASLGRMLGVPTPATDTIVDLAGLMTGQDFRKTGLTLASLGLEGLEAGEFMEFLKTGRSTKVTWSD